MSVVDGRNIISITGALNRISCFELPLQIRKRIVSLMGDLKMNSGSLDFIVTPENEFFFLEVNPVGQFGYLSELGNYMIEKEISKYFKVANEEN